MSNVRTDEIIDPIGNYPTQAVRLRGLHKRYPDKPSGWLVRPYGVASKADSWWSNDFVEGIAFAYRSFDGERYEFIYLPDPSYTFVAETGMLGPDPLDWGEALFLFARFLEGWYSS